MESGTRSKEKDKDSESAMAKDALATLDGRLKGILKVLEDGYNCN